MKMCSKAFTWRCVFFNSRANSHTEDSNSANFAVASNNDKKSCIV